MVGAFLKPSCDRVVPPIHSIPSSVAQALGEELYKLLLYNTRVAPPFHGDRRAVPLSLLKRLFSFPSNDAILLIDRQFSDQPAPVGHLSVRPVKAYDEPERFKFRAEVEISR